MKQNKKIKRFLDVALERGKTGGFSLELGSQVTHKNLYKKIRPTLFSHGTRTASFFTEDSGLYLTPREQRLIEAGVDIDQRAKSWDSLSSRILKNYQAVSPSRKDLMVRTLELRYNRIQEDLAEGYYQFVKGFSLPKFWNVTVVASVLLGMVSMTFIYRYLGEGVSAGNPVAGSGTTGELISQNKDDKDKKEEKVLGAEVSEEKPDKDAEYISKVLENLENKKKEDLEKEIRSMVKGYPIEAMVPYIMKQDKTVAAFIIGIGKKESDWGKRVPVLNGEDCYNYWGYRGIRKRMGTGGHTCFDSPKDAVDTIAKRINTLVYDKKLNTPGKMVIWKTGGNAAATGGQAAANKWISDVDKYFKKLNN